MPLVKDIILEYGWPDHDLVGDEGTLSAWFIAQHAIGDPEFQRQALNLIQEKVRHGRVPVTQEASLFDRVGVSSTVRNPVPSISRWQAPAVANGKSRRSEQRRISMGLPPVPDDRPESEPTAQSRAEYDHWGTDTRVAT